MRILTMGIDNIDKDLFKDSGDIILNKPYFGLYGSTLIHNEYGKWSSWMDFVESNDFHTEKYTNGVSYTLHKKAKIYTVDSFNSYLKLINKYWKEEYMYDDKYEVGVDWDKFKLDYDAFHLTLDAFLELRMLYEYIPHPEYDNCKNRGKRYKLKDFYSYDCETWIIFNLDCINIGSIQNVSIKIPVIE